MGDFDTRAFLALYGGSRGAWGPEMTALTLLGGGWAVLALLPLLGWVRTRRFTSALLIAVLTQASIVWLLKIVFGRVRPWLAFGLPAPLGAPHDGSFPSGHTAGSFCVAAFVVASTPRWSRFAVGHSRLLSILLILLAALVAWSRVYLGAHFPGDVLAGGLIGAVIGAHAAASAMPARQWRCPSKRS